MPLRARLAVFLAASFALVAAFFATLGSGDDRPAATAAPGFAGSLRPAGIAPAEFRMRDQDGKVATLRQYRGKPVVVTFLYTHCQDTCPLTAQQIRGALDDVGHDVPVLAFSVDPKNDTELSARRFLGEQHVTGRMRFLLGPLDQLHAQWKAYGIRPQTNTHEHNAYVVVLDKQGVQRVAFPSGELTPEDLAHDIKALG